MSAALYTGFTIYPRLTQPGYTMHTASSRAKQQQQQHRSATTSHRRRRSRHSDASGSVSTSTPTPRHPAIEINPVAHHNPHLAMTSGHAAPPAYAAGPSSSSSSASAHQAPGSATQRRRSRELAEMRQWSAQQQAALAAQQQAMGQRAQAQPQASPSRHQQQQQAQQPPAAAAAAAAPSASSSSSQRKRPTDPYYGHQSASTMASSFIISMFNCPNVPPASSVEPGAPLPTLAHFVAYALYRTRLPHFVTLTALLLLGRLKTRFPQARGSSGHRLFISAFMIASKVVCDDTYSNQSWCTVGQKMFSLKEMNQMEREMCGYLEWNLNATTAEVDELEVVLLREHTQAPRPTTPGRPIAPLKKSAVSATSAGIASAEASAAHASGSASVHGSPMSVASGTPSPQLVAHPPISSASQRPVAPLPRSASSSRRGSQQRGVSTDAAAAAAAAAAAFPSNPYHSLAASRSQTQPQPQMQADRRASMAVDQQMFLPRIAGMDGPASRRDSAPVMSRAQPASADVSPAHAGFGNYDQDATMAYQQAQQATWTHEQASRNSSSSSVASQPGYVPGFAVQWPGQRSQSTSALHHLHPNAMSHLSPFPGLVPSAMSSQQSSPESQACQTPSPANALGSASVVPAGAAPAVQYPGNKADPSAIPHIPAPWSS